MDTKLVPMTEAMLEALALDGELIYAVRKYLDVEWDESQLIAAGLAMCFRNFPTLLEHKIIVALPRTFALKTARACGEPGCGRAFESASAVEKHFAKRHSPRALAEVERQKRRDEADEVGRRDSERLYSTTASTCPCCGSAKPPGHKFVVTPEEWTRITKRERWGAAVAPLSHTIAAVGPNDSLPPAA